MSESLDYAFFDYAFQILNYAIEFVNTPGYSCLRFIDLLEKTISMALKLEDIKNKSFYEKIQNKFKERRLVSDSKTREDFMNDLLSLFVDEWKKQ